MAIKVRITKRDLQCIKWLSQQGLATYDQLWRAVFEKNGLKSYNYAQKRTKKLARLGFLIRNTFLENHNKKKMVIYRVSMEGYKIAQKKWNDLINPMENISFDNFYIIEKLNEIRIHLENNLILVNWWDERTIKKKIIQERTFYAQKSLEHFNYFPKSMVQKFNGHIFLIELEDRERSLAFYQEKINYFNKMDVYKGKMGYLWIFVNEDLANKVSHLINENFSICNFRFISYNNLFTADLNNLFNLQENINENINENNKEHSNEDNFNKQNLEKNDINNIRDNNINNNINNNNIIDNLIDSNAIENNDDSDLEKNFQEIYKSKIAVENRLEEALLKRESKQDERFKYDEEFYYYSQIKYDTEKSTQAKSQLDKCIEELNFCRNECNLLSEELHSLEKQLYKLEKLQKGRNFKNWKALR